MRAEVGEANMGLPPVKGWEVYTRGKLMFWTDDHVLECSRHLTNHFRFSDPSVLQSTRGEAGVFSEYKSRTLGQVLKKTTPPGTVTANIQDFRPKC